MGFLLKDKDWLPQSWACPSSPTAAGPLCYRSCASRQPPLPGFGLESLLPLELSYAPQKILASPQHKLLTLLSTQPVSTVPRWVPSHKEGLAVFLWPLTFNEKDNSICHILTPSCAWAHTLCLSASPLQVCDSFPISQMKLGETRNSVKFTRPVSGRPVCLPSFSTVHTAS